MDLLGRLINFVILSKWPLDAHKCAYYLCRWHFTTCQYPNYHYKKLVSARPFQQALQGSPLERQECKKYLKFSKKYQSHLIFWSMWLFYAMIVLKDTIYIYFTLIHGQTVIEKEHGENEKGYKVASSNVTTLSTSITQLACLRTNCTRLSLTNLLRDDLVKLPIFSICQPFWANNFYGPLIDSNNIGLLFYCEITYAILCMSCLATIASRYMYSSFSAVMFFNCPNLELNFVRHDIREFHINKISSFINFKLKKLTNNLKWLENISISGQRNESMSPTTPRICNSNKRLSVLLNSPKLLSTQPQSSKMTLTELEQPNTSKRDMMDIKRKVNKSITSLLRLQLLFSNRQLTNQKPELTMENLDDYIEDCVPLTKSFDWWFYISPKIMVFVPCCSYAVWIFFLFALYFWMELYPRRVNLAELKQMSQFVDANNCSIWNQQTNEPTRFNEIFERHWTLAELIYYYIKIAMPIYTLIMATSLLHMATSDLHLMLVQVVEQALAAIEFGELNSYLKLGLANSNSIGHNNLSGQFSFRHNTMSKLFTTDWAQLYHIEDVLDFNESNFCLSQLKERLKQRIKLSNCIAQYKGNQRSLKASRERQKYAYDIMEAINFDPLLSDKLQTEMLDKCLLSFQLFVKNIDSYSRAFGITLFFANLINYGFSIIAVYFYRNINHQIIETLFLIIVSSGVINFLVFIASYIHAKANRMQPSLWKLMAQCADIQTDRMVFLRSLWIRRIEFLERDGGLGCKMLGIRINYANIIQTLFYTSTVLLFALQKY